MTMNDITLYERWLPNSEATILFEHLYIGATHYWSDELISSSGEAVKIKRQMSYLSENGQDYNYAGLTLKGQRLRYWDTITETMDDIGYFLELTKPLNSVLLNLYPDGKSEIRWHSDKEPQLGDSPIIPCLNLGATRTFWFLNKKTGVKTAYSVGNGDLLVMGPDCQKNYLHAILKEKGVDKPRISCTFRHVYEI